MKYYIEIMPSRVDAPIWKWIFSTGLPWAWAPKTENLYLVLYRQESCYQSVVFPPVCKPLIVLRRLIHEAVRKNIFGRKEKKMQKDAAFRQRLGVFIRPGSWISDNLRGTVQT